MSYYPPQQIIYHPFFTPGPAINYLQNYLWKCEFYFIGLKTTEIEPKNAKNPVGGGKNKICILVFENYIYIFWQGIFF